VKPIELETIESICQRALAQKALESIPLPGPRADQNA
jgi:hypothetical protein